MATIKGWLKEKTTWAALATLVAVIGEWYTTGRWGEGNTQALLAAVALALLKGRDLSALVAKKAPGRILPPDGDTK